MMGALFEDRPALEVPEIEITPEMIEAGVAELMLFNLDYQSWEDGAERVFEAMMAARIPEGR